MKNSSIRQIRKAVIPAAGLGTRFLPATKAIPKEMLPIIDVPTIQYIVKEAVDSGIEEVIFITGKGKQAITDHFDAYPELEQKLERDRKFELLAALKETSSLVKVVAVRQPEARGLGHAVLCAKQLIGDEPFLVLLGDDLVDSPVPCARQMIDVFDRRGKSVVALMRVAQEEIPNFGICGGRKISARELELDSMVEKPSIEDAPSQFAIVGRYILEPEIFAYLEKVEPDAGGEIQLTEAMAELMRDRGFIGYEFDGERYDAGDKFGFIKANIAYALKRHDLGPRLRAYLRGLV